MMSPRTSPVGGQGMTTRSTVPNGNTWMGGRVRLVGCAALTAAVPLALVILANLPKTEAFGGPGTWGLPACLAACLAASAAASSTGPWTAFAVWTACKAACIAGAFVF